MTERAMRVIDDGGFLYVCCLACADHYAEHVASVHPQVHAITLLGHVAAYGEQCELCEQTYATAPEAVQCDAVIDGAVVAGCIQS